MHPTLYRPALVLTTALAASLHLLGCASGNAADAPPLRLDASSWVVAALRGSALVTGQTVTLRFEQGRVTGSHGCNRYSAAYRQDGPADLSIDPSTHISTQMASSASRSKVGTGWLAASSTKASSKGTPPASIIRK